MTRLVVDGQLSLELLEGRHAPELFNLIQTNRARLRRWLPWLEHHSGPDDTEGWIDAVREQHAHREAVILGIRSGLTLAGVVGLDALEWSNRKATLGYWLGESFLGRGLCTRACRTLLEHGFRALDLNRVELYCAPANERSRAIAMRLGFSREGLLREAEWLYDHFVDYELFALLAAEWNHAVHR
jgi:ribosomal-protein-serine acetyltransferase